MISHSAQCVPFILPRTFSDALECNQSDLIFLFTLNRLRQNVAVAPRASL
jgi:hypothetical protein